MATNADSMFPTASGLIRAEYPVTTPRDSSRRTRDWTADTDSPAVAARWASVARPSATSSRTRYAVDLVELHRFMRVFVGFAHGRTVSESVDTPMSRRVETWQLRAKFAAALSRMYAAEVPAYTTLVEVSAGVNREHARHPRGDRLGSRSG